MATGTVSTAGVGSGIDVNSIITKLMTVEQKPLDNLKTKEASYQAKLTAFGTLKGSLSSVQTAVDSLNSNLLFKTMSATSSNTATLSASANTAAAAGSYSIDVQAIAQGETIASNTSFSSLTSNIASSDGQIHIELGTTSGTVFTPNAGTTPVSIDISATNSSLSSIRDAINKANAGVTARIVDVGGSTHNYKLVIASNSTGASQSMRVTTWDSTGTTQTTDNTGLAQFAFDPAAAAGSGNEYQVTAPAQDAHVKLNNLDVYRSSNTFSDLITGVTVTLKGQGTTTLSVAKDTSGVKSAIDSFVKAYNTAADQVRQLSAYNATTGKGAVLTGDSGARSLQDALSQMMNYSVMTDSPDFRTLTDLGVTVQRDGSLEFDSTVLDKALSSNPTAVSQLVGGVYDLKTTDSKGAHPLKTPGIATRLKTLMSSIMDEKSGILTTSTNGINSTIKDIQNQETSMQTRLNKILANYQTQFAAMDSFVSSWNSTSSYLTQQLAALNGNSNSK
jgi:flagellar hook-associated protein 2